MTRRLREERQATCLATRPERDGRWLIGTGVALLVALGALAASAPAGAQWRHGAHADPNAVAQTRTERIAGYAQMVDAWGDRLARAVREVEDETPADISEAVMSRPRMHLLDTAQTAWVVVQNVPEGFDDRAAYEAAERQFQDSLTAMRVASTPTPRALEEARKIVAALERLEAAAAAATRAAIR